MKTLIVEDDPAVSLLLRHLLSPFGGCHVAENGVEAVQAFTEALDWNAPYDLVCLDIMMPEMDGQEALRRMREAEEAVGLTALSGSKIVMITALGDYRSVSDAHHGLCTAYLVKPFSRKQLMDVLVEQRLLTPEQAAEPAPGA